MGLKIKFFIVSFFLFGSFYSVYSQSNILNAAAAQATDPDSYVHHYALGYGNNQNSLLDDSSYVYSRNVYMFGSRQRLIDCENVVTLGGVYDSALLYDASNDLVKVKNGIIAGHGIEVKRVTDVVSLGRNNIINTSACTDTVNLDSSNIYQMGESNGVYLQQQTDGNPTTPIYTVPDSSVTSFAQFGSYNQHVVSYVDGTFADVRRINVSGMTTMGVDNVSYFVRNNLYSSVTAADSTVLGAANS